MGVAGGVRGGDPPRIRSDRSGSRGRKVLSARTVAAVVSPGFGARRRWAVVAGLVALLVGLPPVIAAIPASDGGVPAADLRSAVLASDTVAFSGYAESSGGLALPVTDRLASVAD